MLATLDAMIRAEVERTELRLGAGERRRREPRAGLETDEHEARLLAHRDRRQTKRRAVDVAEPLLARNGVQRAVGGVAPCVVRTDEKAGVSASGRDPHAAMAAGVDEGP